MKEINKDFYLYILLYFEIILISPIVCLNL